MKLRIKSIVILGLCMLLLLCSCDSSEVKNELSNNTSVEETIMLNQRQKKILEDMRLPTDYDSLTTRQKNAIIAIEEMLSYLEGKYDDKFEYYDYYEAVPGIEAHLEAGCSVGIVTVYRRSENGTDSYTDDYMAVSTSPQYGEIIENYIGQFFNPSSYKVFSIVSDVKKIDEDLLSVASATSFVFFDRSVAESDFDEFVQEYANWIKQNAQGNAIVTKFFLLKNDDLNSINKYNYEEKLYEVEYTKNRVCSLSSLGVINVF